MSNADLFGPLPTPPAKAARRKAPAPPARPPLREATPPQAAPPAPNVVALEPEPTPAPAPVIDPPEVAALAAMLANRPAQRLTDPVKAMAYFRADARRRLASDRPDWFVQQLKKHRE